MLSLTTTAGDVVWPAGQRVSTRATWQEEWTVEPDVWCEELALAAAPGISEARLTYRYGRGVAGLNVRTLPPRDWLNRWVKIELVEDPRSAAAAGQDEPRTIAWVGIITADGHERQGLLPPNTPTGRQTLAAVGIEKLFHERLVDGTAIEPGPSDQGVPRMLARTVPFNGGRGNGRAQSLLVGNRATARALFTRDFLLAKAWKAIDVVDYLLAYFNPGRRHYPPVEDDGEIVPIEREYEGGTNNLNRAEIQVDPGGKSVAGVLGEIAGPARLLGWWVEYGSGTNLEEGSSYERFVVRFFSHAANAITLPGALGADPAFVQANPRQWVWDFSRARDVVRADTLEDLAGSYDQVIVRGARRTTTATWGRADGVLSQGWAPSAEEDWLAGASDEATYEQQPWTIRRAWNRSVREGDLLAGVFSQLELLYDWDGKLKDGLGGGSSTVAFPREQSVVVSLDPDTSQSAPFWVPGLVFSPLTAMLEDFDHTAGVPSEEVRAVGRLRPPFCVLRIPETNYLGTTPRWYYGHAAGHTGEIDRVTSGGPQWSLSVLVLQDRPALRLVVQGAEQTVLAKGALLLDEDDPAIISLSDVLVTATVEADQHVEVRVPETPAAAEGEPPPRRLWLEIPECRLDWIAPQTVVGLTADGELKRITDPKGKWLCDDRGRLRQVGQLAYQWYFGRRRAFRFLVQQTLFGPQVGDLIAEIGPPGAREAVNTAIRQIRYTLGSEGPPGQAAVQTTEIVTDLPAFDPQLFLVR